VEYLVQARVIRPAIFISGASVFPGLASEKDLTPKNFTPVPPMANNDHHHNHGRHGENGPLVLLL